MGKKDLGDLVKPTASDGTLEVYSGISARDALIYDCLHIALLKQYNLTEHGYQKRLREQSLRVKRPQASF